MLKGLRGDFLLVLLLMGAAAWGLSQVLRDLGGMRALVPGRGGSMEASDPPLQLAEAGALFQADAMASQSLPADAPSGFHTTHFAPPPKPPRQKPTTRKVELTYLGFLQGGDGPRTAVVQTDSEQWIGGVGSNLIANLFVSTIDQRALVVTNSDGQTNQLEFRTKTALDVPAQ